MKTDVWMPIYIGDYTADTMGLTTVEHGAYFLLMMAYWRNGGPLRNEPKFLATICGMTPGKWERISPTILKFFQVSELVLSHKRIDFELANAKKNSLQMADNARKRWCRSNAPAYAESMPNGCPSPSPSPSPSTKKPTKLAKPLTEDESETACKGERVLGVEWRNDAGKWIKRIRKQRVLVDEIFSAVKVELEMGNIRQTVAGYTEDLWKRKNA